MPRLSFYLFLFLSLCGSLSARAQTDAQADAAWEQVHQLRARYAQPDLPAEDRFAALDQALDGLRALVAQFPQHWQRPVWQTELADLLLYEWLTGPRQHADLFVEFGLPTTAQRQAVEQASLESFTALREARRAFDRLSKELPAQPDHEAQRVQTQKWPLWLAYRDHNLPILTAKAALLLSLLPADSPALKKIAAAPPWLPEATNLTLDNVRRRLREDLAIDNLEPLTGQEIPAPLRAETTGLLARALLGLGRGEQAQPLLAELQARNDLLGFTATLVRSRVLFGQKDFEAALQLLREPAQSSFLQSDPLCRLLLADAMFLQHRAQPGHAQDPSAAYLPYDQLLGAADLAPDLRAGLGLWLGKRWLEADPDATDPKLLPPLLLSAVAQANLNQARVLARPQTNPSAAASPSPATGPASPALPYYQRATALYENLLARPELPDSLRAVAMSDLGWGLYEQNPSDVTQRLRVAFLWTDLAKRFPSQPISDPAITHAVALLRQLRSAAPASPEQRQKIDLAYQQAVDVLFSLYADSPAADEERIYYASEVYEPSGRFTQAAELYNQVPADHPKYLLAQVARLYALWHAATAAGPTTQAPDLQALAQQAKELDQRAAELRQRNHNPNAQAVAIDAQARVRLLLADVALTEKNYAAVEAVLADLEALVAKQPDLLRPTLAKRVLALQESGRWLDALAAAGRFLDAFPQEAAPVLCPLLDRLDNQFQPITTVVMDGRTAQAMLQSAGELAERALEPQLKLNLAPLQRQSLEFMLARALIARSRNDQAIALLDRLLAQPPQDAPSLGRLAELCFLAEELNPAYQNAARDLYTRLIQGLKPDQPWWWAAWMRRLQIQDQQAGTNTDQEIFLAVKQLEMIDPALGRDPFQSEFRRLASRHEPPLSPPASSSPNPDP
ncbi:MAG: hypothetical protein IT443_12535 [Phycisphaeraceae bacterium]|nr:hypothetical protein [Phycisphaeraceae bacterium]